MLKLLWICVLKQYLIKYVLMRCWWKRKSTALTIYDRLTLFHLIRVMLFSWVGIAAFATLLPEINIIWRMRSEKTSTIDAGVPSCRFRLHWSHKYDICWNCFWTLFSFYCTKITNCFMYKSLCFSNFFSVIYLEV